MINQRVKIANKIIQDVGKSINQNFYSVFKIEKEIKPDKTFVTGEDKRAEKQIVTKILEHFPDDGFIGEEGADKNSKSDFTWILDPIDGTSNFVYRIPLYTSSLALRYKQQTVAGIIYLPSFDQLHYSIKDQGFFTENKKNSVSETKKLAEAMTLFAIPHKDQLLEKNLNLYPEILKSTKKIRLLGCVSYEMLQVAIGLCDGLVNIGSTAWDVEAAVLMIREAGGVVCDFEGKEWTPQTGELIATNKNLKDQYLEIVNNTLK
ncbi:hypothetical protein GF376_02935 [Candidatus Peregrinibacteria bacterium]|nr:hypothetical protein [Candidatus Peregrinibacteria bacterium]